jgi:hypothetical protein
VKKDTVGTAAFVRTVEQNIQRQIRQLSGVKVKRVQELKTKNNDSTLLKIFVLTFLWVSFFFFVVVVVEYEHKSVLMKLFRLI